MNRRQARCRPTEPGALPVHVPAVICQGENYARYVALTAARYPGHLSSSYEDRQDDVAAALYGLMRAVASWRPDGGAAFKTWAIRCMWLALCDERKRRDHLSRAGRDYVKSVQRDNADDGEPAPVPLWAQRPVSLDELLEATYDDGDPGEALVPASLRSPSAEEEALPSVRRSATADRVRRALADLTPLQRVAVERVWLEGMTQEEAGRLEGVSKAAIGKRVQYAWPILRRLLAPAFGEEETG